MKKFTVGVFAVACLFSGLSQAALESDWDWTHTEEFFRCKISGDSKFLCGVIDSAQTPENQRVVLDLINSKANSALAECNRGKVFDEVSPAYYYFIITSRPNDLDQEAAQRQAEMFDTFIDNCSNSHRK